MRKCVLFSAMALLFSTVANAQEWISFGSRAEGSPPPETNSEQWHRQYRENALGMIWQEGSSSGEDWITRSRGIHEYDDDNNRLSILYQWWKNMRGR